MTEEEFYSKLRNINESIELARKSFKKREEIEEEIIEYPFEKDLLRYIAACEYEKSELIKENFNFENIERKYVSQEDYGLIQKILNLRELMPIELHTCIGCPCLENNYPKCEECVFYESCVLGNVVYPEHCVENDCFNSFRWIDNNKKQLKVI